MLTDRYVYVCWSVACACAQPPQGRDCAACSLRGQAGTTKLMHAGRKRGKGARAHRQKGHGRYR
eukprot:5710316-Pleurochrysis_carterae.AAC.4